MKSTKLPTMLFHKGFKCKKKIAEAFSILDLIDIVAIEPEQHEEGEEKAKAEEAEVEDAEKAEVATAEEARIEDVVESTKEVTDGKIEEASIQENVSKVMTEIEAMINTAVKAFKVDLTLAANMQK